MTFLIGLALKAGIPARFAKVAVIVALVVAMIAALGAAKCAYDRSIIKAHDAERNAAIAKADRVADAHAAEQRRADDARITTESQEVKEAINEARSQGRDPRKAYYECVAKQQVARREKASVPDC